MIKIEPFTHWGHSCSALSSSGTLLVTGTDSRANPMTIGWATLGVIWGKPILTVLVRPSRHSFDLIETEPYFSVNVLDVESFRDRLAYCGTKSGRDEDKAVNAGITLQKGHVIPVSIIPQAQLVYECSVVHKTSVIDADLHSDIRNRFYKQGDFHRIYHGEVLGAWKNEDFEP